MTPEAKDHLSEIVTDNIRKHGLASFIKKVDTVSDRDAMIFNYALETCLNVFQISKTSFFDNKKLKRNYDRNESRSSFYYVILSHTGFKQTQIASIFLVHSSNVYRGKQFVTDAKSSSSAFYEEFLAKHRELEEKVEKFSNELKYGRRTND